MGQKDVETPVGIGVLLSTYTTLNYKWRHAIGELVDNSVDSYLQHKKDFPDGIDIYIDYDSSAKTLSIGDTAYGMDFDDMNRAVQITRNNGHEYYESGIGRYGLGMKKSATFLGSKWKLISKSKESSIKYTVSVDVDKLAKTNAKKLTIVDAPSNAKHGTRLEINLAKTMKGTAEQTVKNHLCEMYKRYMDKGQVRIWWNDDQLEYTKPAVRVSKVGDIDTTWSTDLKFEIEGESGKKHEITGSMFILQTMSHTESGLQLFNSNRMIIGGSGSPNENWRPHDLVKGAEGYIARRFCAELNIDCLNPNHQKDGFIWDEFSEEDLVIALKEQQIVKKYLKEAKEQVKEKKDSTDTSTALKNIKNRVDSEEVAAAVKEGLATKDKPVKTLTGEEISDIAKDKGVDAKIGADPSISFSHAEFTFGPLMTTHISSQVDGIDEIIVLINDQFDYLDKVIQTEREQEIWIDIIHALALTEYTIQELDKVEFPKLIQYFGDYLNSFREAGN